MKTCFSPIGKNTLSQFSRYVKSARTSGETIFSTKRGRFFRKNAFSGNFGTKFSRFFFEFQHIKPSFPEIPEIAHFGKKKCAILSRAGVFRGPKSLFFTTFRNATYGETLRDPLFFRHKNFAIFDVFFHFFDKKHVYSR